MAALATAWNSAFPSTPIEIRDSNPSQSTVCDRAGAVPTHISARATAFQAMKFGRLIGTPSTRADQAPNHSAATYSSIRWATNVTGKSQGAMTEDIMAQIPRGSTRGRSSRLLPR